MKKRFSKEQIIGFPREAEAGLAVKVLCRWHGFSEATYYQWRSQFGGRACPRLGVWRELEAEGAPEEAAGRLGAGERSREGGPR